jgi:hypothetical protein
VIADGARGLPYSRWLALSALFLVLLAVAGCDAMFDEAANEVQTGWGIDIRDPSDVALAAIGARVAGDKEKADALDVYRAIRREEHWEAGARLHDAGNYYQARLEYREAIKWTPTTLGTPAQKDKAGAIYCDIADSYQAEAASKKSPDEEMALRRQAGRSWAAGAALVSDPERKRAYYRAAADSAHRGGDHQASCGYLRSATADADTLAAYGCR